MNNICITPLLISHFAADQMIRRIVTLFAACALGISAHAQNTAAQTTHIGVVKVIAFNDFHGSLEPPRIAVPLAAVQGQAPVLIPAGGAAYLASAIRNLRAQNPQHVVVSAGDLIGATPLPSALFLDEPTIEVANAMHVDFNAVGNHEFDKGTDELLRMARGGCTQYTRLIPCQINPQFGGASFGFLAANVFKSDGETLFPAYGMKEFVFPTIDSKDTATSSSTADTRIKVAFVGMTLKNTPSIVTPSGVAGLVFKDEAQTANALVPTLLAQGANAIVVVLHEGGWTEGSPNINGCEGLRGEIVPILEKLDPRIDAVISGHTHRSYVCQLLRQNLSNEVAASAVPRSVTSAGQHGTLVTSLDMQFDLVSKKLIQQSANNVVVQSEAFENATGRRIIVSEHAPQFAKDQKVDAIVTTYVRAAAQQSQRVVGVLSASLTRSQSVSGESTLGNLIADAQLAATQAPEKGGSQLALMNPGGVRADLMVPAQGGNITYGELFSVQPFGNNLVVKDLTGDQIKRLLEQQFANTENPRILFPSQGFSYTFDMSKPRGERVSELRLGGVGMQEERIYRVTMNSFLATGGDAFTVFNQGLNALGGDLDVDALEAYLRDRVNLVTPATNRIKRLN